MSPTQTFFFPPFRLDAANEQLWQRGRLLPLRPKTFAVLRHLVERAGVLVTKEELLEAVWPATHGAEGLPKKSVYELRKVLKDAPDAPRFIETVPRRGWRFIAALTTPPPRSAARASHPVASLVGRADELARLRGWLGGVLQGQRQVVFVTGEPGIGKTAVVDALWTELADEDDLYLARGQCIEHHGAGEAYLPVLEALGRVGQGAGGEPLVRLLRRYAPTWLLQLPALIEDAELEALRRKVLGAPKERMLREIADALEALGAERPLVLWLEDLQWSDYSTLDLIRYLAQRPEPARLFLIGTFRPADVIAGDHPLRAVQQELQGHAQAAELPLRCLTAAEVGEYLASRFGAGSRAPAPYRELARIVHQNSDGTPLFMVTMVDYLAAQGVLSEADGHMRLQGRLEDVAAVVPDTLRLLIEKQLDGLGPDEQRALEVASVAGAEFSSMAVAAGLAELRERVEEWCEALARRDHFLVAQDAEPLPDGTVAGHFRFRHALYQKVVYERLGPARRMRLHRLIGEGVEAVHGKHVGDMAAGLAMHFERGQDYPRAVQYLVQAGRNAVRRSANREAIDLLARGLALLGSLPDGRERAGQELELQASLAVPLMMTRGYTAPEVKSAYERARELCRQIGETPYLFPVVVGLSRFYYGRSSVERKNSSAEELLRLAHHGQDSSLLLVAHMMQGGNLFFQGDFARALAHAEEGIAIYDPLQHRALIFQYGDDPQVLCHCWAALALWYLGHPDRALERVDQALRIAEDLTYPFGVVFARFWAAFIHQSRGEAGRAEAQADALVAFARAHSIPQFAAMGTIVRGWAVARRGDEDAGLAELRRGMDDLRAVGQELGRPYFCALLAETYRRRGQLELALGVVNEAVALTQKTGECMHQADLYRLQGELLLTDERSAPDDAEACFQQALGVARRQNARSLELRAAMSLSRLWQRRGAATNAYGLLAEIHGQFTDGLDTEDLRAGSALLMALTAGHGR
jgi:DNA-binding winged helix-turn-helix (wHTH) protein/predicted ATPase